jgi:hypothetical protein
MKISKSLSGIKIGPLSEERRMRKSQSMLGKKQKL